MFSEFVAKNLGTYGVTEEFLLQRVNAQLYIENHMKPTEWICISPKGIFYSLGTQI